jgi:hypothetical protein
MASFTSLASTALVCLLSGIACGADDGSNSGSGGTRAAGGSPSSGAGSPANATGGSAPAITGGAPPNGGIAGRANGGAGNAAGNGGSMGGGAAPSTAGEGGRASVGLGGTSGAGGVAGSGGTSAGPSSGGTANAGASGAAAKGGASTAGGGAGGGLGADGDPEPPRPLNVTAAKARHEHTFRAKTADSAVSFNDNSEIAVFDNRAPIIMGKLVLPFGGLGTNAGTLEAGGEFCARRGFHVLGIAAFQDYDILSNGADFFGEARRSVFEGIVHTQEGEFANIEMTPADGVAQRTQKALVYLHAQYPEEDWGYFLQEDGSVRWSDVIFSGFSHGGSNAARFAFLVRASRVVSLSAPRENTCTRLDLANCGGTVATWLGETSKTPMDRFFAITGKTDDQHLQHLFALEKTGYSGAATAIDGAQPPYGNSHRLVANAGHTDFCQLSNYAAVCNYAFGVPSENQAGTSP